MNNKIRNLLAALGLAAAAFAPAANAGLLTVTIAGQVCADGAACDLNALPNQVTVIGGVSPGIVLPAGFTATIGTSFSNNPGGAGGFAILDLTWTLSTIGGVGGPLVITSFQDGFTFPPPGLAHLTSTISGDIENGSVIGQQFLDDFTPGPQGPFTAPFVDIVGLDVILVGPYSLMEVLTFDLGPDTTSTGDFRSVVRLPEPGTLALLGLALVGFAVSRRKS